jgi:hypothetical protein
LFNGLTFSGNADADALIEMEKGILYYYALKPHVLACANEETDFACDPNSTTCSKPV